MQAANSHPVKKQSRPKNIKEEFEVQLHGAHQLLYLLLSALARFTLVFKEGFEPAQFLSKLTGSVCGQFEHS